MEKTIQLDQRELQTAQAIDQELMRAWAQIGVLSEQFKQAEKTRERVIEKQRDFLQQAVAARGITSYNNAQPGPNGTVVITLPDEPAMVEAAKPNGIAVAAEAN